MILLLIFSFFISTTIYIYLHKKTKISKKFIYLDNILVGLCSFLLTFYSFGARFISFLISALFVVLFTFTFTMIRFWRKPKRIVSVNECEIVSPADGRIIYINKIETNEVPISTKLNTKMELTEITKTNLLSAPCWQIGINMTPFDVHKNCSPIKGKVILTEYHPGKFFSLKNPLSLVQNERHTYVIQNDQIKVGVIQIASKRVRRIDSYVKVDDQVLKGQWIGMIRFGSQVDLIVPMTCKLRISVGQQVYAVSTVLAETI